MFGPNSNQNFKHRQKLQLYEKPVCKWRLAEEQLFDSIVNIKSLFMVTLNILTLVWGKAMKPLVFTLVGRQSWTDCRKNVCFEHNACSLCLI